MLLQGAQVARLNQVVIYANSHFITSRDTIKART